MSIRIVPSSQTGSAAPTTSEAGEDATPTIADFAIGETGGEGSSLSVVVSPSFPLDALGSYAARWKAAINRAGQTIIIQRNRDTIATLRATFARVTEKEVGGDVAVDDETILISTLALMEAGFSGQLEETDRIVRYPERGDAANHVYEIVINPVLMAIRDEPVVWRVTGRG